MLTWQAFERETPDFAAAGHRLLTGEDGVAIAYLATASASGAPHIAPVCPIFADAGLYLSAAGTTPKVTDLRQNPAYSLHAFLGANDEEFQIQGVAREVTSADEREAVFAAIRFGSYDREHPVFHFALERALWVHWERVGQPDTRAIRRRWIAT